MNGIGIENGNNHNDVDDGCSVHAYGIYISIDLATYFIFRIAQKWHAIQSNPIQCNTMNADDETHNSYLRDICVFPSLIFHSMQLLRLSCLVNRLFWFSKLIFRFYRNHAVAFFSSSFSLVHSSLTICSIFFHLHRNVGVCVCLPFDSIFMLSVVQTLICHNRLRRIAFFVFDFFRCCWCNF